MDGAEKFSFMMRKQLKTALVLAALLTLAGCDKEALLEEPDPITVVVTVEYPNGKIIQFIYHDELVWQSDLVESMSYHRNGDQTEIDYTDLRGQDNHLTFQGGELVKKQ